MTWGVIRFIFIIIVENKFICIENTVVVTSNPYPKLIVDATGSIIKNIYKFNLETTRSIFLYEAIIYDEVNKRSTTLTNMLTERHTTISIFNWLAKWLSCNIPQPRQTVCDQSLALLSAIAQCLRNIRHCKTMLKYVEIINRSNS